MSNESVMMKAVKTACVIDESCGASEKSVEESRLTRERLGALLEGPAMFTGFEETKWPYVYKSSSSNMGWIYWDRLFYAELNPFGLHDLGIAPEELGFNSQPGTEAHGMFKPGDYKSYLIEESERVNGAAIKGDWEYAFALVEKKIAIGSYLICFDVIPDDKKWDAFIEMYTRCELGFEMLEDVYEDIFSYAYLSKKRAKRLRKLAKVAGKEFVIYHGAKFDDSSWNPKDYYSWTLSEKTAKFFAARWNNRGEIWKMKINHGEAVDYLIDRNEEEVLVNYEALEGREERYGLDKCRA